MQDPLAAGLRIAEQIGDVDYLIRSEQRLQSLDPLLDFAGFAAAVVFAEDMRVVRENRPHDTGRCGSRTFGYHDCLRKIFRRIVPSAQMGMQYAGVAEKFHVVQVRRVARCLEQFASAVERSPASSNRFC